MIADEGAVRFEDVGVVHQDHCLGLARNVVQIAVVTFEVEDFDGDDLVEGEAESAVDRGTDPLANLLVEKVMLLPDGVLLLFHLLLLLWIELEGNWILERVREVMSRE